MLVQVLPADPRKEVYFTDVADGGDNTYRDLGRLVHGPVEVVRTQALINKFGCDPHNGMPLVGMIIHEEGRVHNLPVNLKATQYYPNEFDLQIHGDAVLVGLKMDPEEGLDVADMPAKWKTIYDMETVLADDDLTALDIHHKLDRLLLESVDPDIKKMYLEAYDQIATKWWGKAV